MREVSETEIAQILKELEIYGYSAIRQGLIASEVKEYRARVNECYEATKKNQYEGRPERDIEDKMVYNLQYKQKAFIDLLGYGPLRKILMEKLNDKYYRFLPTNVPNYQLKYFNARSSGNKLDLHIDSYIPAVGEHTWVMQVAFMLDDSNSENGCTTVVPGSHLSGRYTDRDLKDIKLLEAKAGDILIWDSRLWHGTAENSSKRDRWSIIATLSMWWVKQTMNMTRGLSQEIYSQLSDEQKCLLGFCAIPPDTEFTRINTKVGYESLLPKVEDYYK